MDNRRLLDLLASLEIVARRNRRVERAVLLLRYVRSFDLGQVEALLIDGQNVNSASAAGVIAGNQQVAELPLQEFLLRLASLAAGQGRPLDVLASGAGQEQ